MLGLGLLACVMGYAEARSCLSGICESLRDIRKVHTIAKIGHLCGKATGISLVNLQVVWVRVSGNHQDWAKGVSPFDGNSNVMPACICTLGGVGFNKGILFSTCTSVKEKDAPLSLTLKPENSFPLLCPWHFSSCIPSAGAQSE